MTRTRVLIVDDEPSARDAMRELLAADPDVAVIGECRNGHEAVERIRAGGIDLVFLDVQMPELDGVSAIEQIGNDAPTVVFVTAYDQYLLRAFDVHAVDYVLKPFSDERFHAALAHAKRMVERAEGQRLAERLAEIVSARTAAPPEPTEYLRRLPVRRDDRVSLVPIASVDWIQADGDYVWVHVGSIQYMIRETMGRLEAQLDPAQFARIHRSTIVNLDRVRELHPLFKGDHDVILTDGVRLKLSRHFKEPLERHLGRSL